MPNFATYKQLHSQHTVGEALKAQSDMIMDATWERDIASSVGYLYDYYHDDEPLTLHDLHPENSKVKTPIDIKVIKSASQTYEKDQVTTHIQFRPHQNCNVDYYDEVFAKRYSAVFPIGLYIDVKDYSGKYNRWLIVENANLYNIRQFPTYQILPCDRILQYIYDNTKCQIAGVMRSQNS